MTIEEAQKECIRRFPIGCTYKHTETGNIFILKNDSNVYNTVGTNYLVQAHKLGGLLYDNRDGKNIFVELISYPEGYVKPKEPEPIIDDFEPLVKLLKEIT